MNSQSLILDNPANRYLPETSFDNLDKVNFESDREQIFNLIKQNPNLNLFEIAEILNRELNCISGRLTELKQKGYIKSNGKKTTSHKVAKIIENIIVIKNVERTGEIYLAIKENYNEKEFLKEKKITYFKVPTKDMPTLANLIDVYKKSVGGDEAFKLLVENKENSALTILEWEKILYKKYFNLIIENKHLGAPYLIGTCYELKTQSKTNNNLIHTTRYDLLKRKFFCNCKINHLKDDYNFHDREFYSEKEFICSHIRDLKKCLFKNRLKMKEKEKKRK